MSLKSFRVNPHPPKIDGAMKVGVTGSQDGAQWLTEWTRAGNPRGRTDITPLGRPGLWGLALFVGLATGDTRWRFLFSLGLAWCLPRSGLEVDYTVAGVESLSVPAHTAWANLT
eukprot:2080251-Prymnesium_polylepis.1